MYKKLIILIMISVSLFGSDLTNAKKNFDNKKYAKAYNGFLKAANEGTIAKFNIGFMHEFGFGVKKDIKKAIFFYRMSANDGYAVAQNSLGNAYLKGIGVEKSLKNAITLYQLAAKQGNKEAVNSLNSIQKSIDKLKENFAYITIKSNVKKDKVYIDGKYVGKTKIKVAITPNVIHKIEVRKKGYKTYKFQNVRLKPKQSKTIRAILTR